MTQFRTYAAVGMREDLSDIIYNIAPTDTPFMSTICKTKATAVYHEWQTDSLAAAAANAAVEGADASSATLSPTTRVGNRTQISQKTVAVTGTLQAVDKAGRKSELAYQLSKASSEIKRDMEFTLLNNTVQANGTAGSTARVLGGLQTWLSSNGDFGSGGSAGSSGTTARTNGTNRTFTETELKTVIKEVFESGGSPKILMVTPAHKQTVSALTPACAATVTAATATARNSPRRTGRR